MVFLRYAKPLRNLSFPFRVAGKDGEPWTAGLLNDGQDARRRQPFQRRRP